MEYLEYFKLGSEPFSNAPMSRFYYGSHQHSEALRRLQYVANSMKGLAICIGDIGHGKTTLARRMLDALPEEDYEAAMLVIVHAGITANWLLKRIASQLGVEEPADDKLAILSQLYNRLLEIHSQGKRAVVLIDEAQMLGTRELMEEFRGLLNLEVPEHKLITFIFFGLPEIENNLRLDPPLAQRIALRYHLRPLTVADTTAYIHHRLKIAGATTPLFPDELMSDIHRLTNGVPRLINTLCDNVLLEMYFARKPVADKDLVADVGTNLGLPEDPNASPPVQPPVVDDTPAVEGSEGHDAISVVERNPTPAADYDDQVMWSAAP
ncbi:MAG: AAA family ATPase, partial [Myxococcota bacterium]